MKKLKIGAINWDAFAEKDAYFTSYAINSLGNEKYSSRLPYYVQKNGEEYTVPTRTLEEYEKELMYAIEGGIDFFAYCWYPEADGECTIGKYDEGLEKFKPHYKKLNYARKLYQQSELNKKIGMCAIVFCEKAYAKADFDELFSAMEQDYYVKVDNKPLVIVYNRYEAEFIDIFKKLAGERGTVPYIAFVDNVAEACENVDYTKADATTAYSVCYSAENFEAFSNLVNECNERRTKFGVSVLPFISAGWNPSPRVERPVPWCTYRDLPYAEKPTAEEMDKTFADLAKFVENCPQADTGCALVFAWNEFEEGGYLCPTLKSDGSADDSLLKSFAAAKNKYIKNN